MHERDSDRIIYEKLKDYKADYSSADWEQMETMLPQKSRTPYYAVAALLLLLLGFVGLWVATGSLQQENNAIALKENTITNESKGDEAGSATNSSEQINQSEIAVNATGTADQNGIEKAVVSAENRVVEETASSEKGMSPAVAEQITREKIFKKSEGAKESIQQSNSNSGERYLTSRTFSKGGVEEPQTSKQKKDIRSEAEEKSYSKGSTEATESVAAHGKNEKIPTGAGEARLVASANVFNTGRNEATENNTSSISEAIGVSGGRSTTETESIFALGTIESGLIQQADGGEGVNLSARDALSAEAVPAKKLKKQIVSFVMGAGAGMSFSFIDPALLTKPGYTVDMAEELMFVKRIGIALTQGYSKRVYDGGAFPCPEGMVDCPNSYSSTISSVDLGVDIKANLVNKTKWSWYVKAGVINTVKLREEFTYNYTKIDTIAPPPTQLPPQTNFGGTNEFQSDSQSLGITSDSEYPPDLTVSGPKRYHIAYHAAMGFDISLHPRIKMQMEAGHSFTQPTVGVEDNRLHSFGLNARVLYRLSK